MVANLVSGLLAPTPTHFAPAQSGPFRERTATEDLSPVLNEVTGAEITEKCQENLKKVTAGAEDSVAAETGDNGAVPLPDEETTDSGEGMAPPETGACARKWVCLPALDNPLLTTFCPSPDVVDRETPNEPRPRNSEWTWDWN